MNNITLKKIEARHSQLITDFVERIQSDYKLNNKSGFIFLNELYIYSGSKYIQEIKNNKDREAFKIIFWKVNKGIKAYGKNLTFIDLVNLLKIYNDK